MTTPLNNLPQTNDSQMNEMQSDDNSKLVSEILQEMNKAENNPQNMQEPVYDTNNNSLNRQMDPSVNMMAMDNIVGSENIVNEPEIEMTVDSQSLSMKDNLLNMVKEPAIVSALVILIFSPIVKNLLVRYVSKVYNSASTTMKWVGLVIQSLLVGILFLGVKQVV